MEQINQDNLVTEPVIDTRDANKGDPINVVDHGGTIQVRETYESSESGFVDATQVGEIVRETQDIVEFHKEKVQDFLEKSWANMDDFANDED